MELNTNFTTNNAEAIEIPFAKHDAVKADVVPPPKAEAVPVPEKKPAEPQQP